MQTIPAKILNKNQFKCFHCRGVFQKKEGEWFNWSGMQVHLCQPCDRTTKASPERK